MIGALIQRLDYLFNLCQNIDDYTIKKSLYEWAFGAVRYHIILFPDDSTKAENLWNDYQVLFISRLWQ